MGMFDMGQEPTYENDTTHLADSVMRRYFQYRTADRAMDLVGSLYENSQEKRRRQNEELDLKLKRHALGLPMDDQEYEDATNEDFPMHTWSMGALASKHAAQAIPEPGFLTPPRALSRKATTLLSTGSEMSVPFGTVVKRALGTVIGRSTHAPTSAIARLFGRG